ncbi:MAG: alpha-1,4-glucan--maltose-1-phosphate maltosyltransferase [Chloroflexota bacterium]
MTGQAPPIDGRRRAVIEGVVPQVDGGRFPIKRTVGDLVTVEADAFADGHDEVAVVLRFRGPGDEVWTEQPMTALGNDRWRAAFRVDRVGRAEYTVVAWTDRWGTWRHDLEKRLDASQDVTVDVLIGAELVANAVDRAQEADRASLVRWRDALADTAMDATARARRALEAELDDTMTRSPDRSHATQFEPTLSVVVDPVEARFSTWYELFPRSTSSVPGRHGTFRDVIDRLPYVARLGFDVLYLPPIHPIGTTFRKGPNNVTAAGPGDPGVPWAIGSAEGGHTAIHSELGTLPDLEALVDAAAAAGIAVALDIAFQASPDHPAVSEHPSWFRQRPDGTVQYAENPPKKYQDIYPFDFESVDWASLWDELCRVFRFWIGHGIRIFRVDNPHTKPFAFWEWAIEAIKRDHPDVLFLAEAFTRPKIMYRLAKLGFSQSYTYFTWRTGKQELIDYFGELTRGPVSEFFRPNLWPNTPDILHETLQVGGRPMFEARLVMAATLAASYGIYGPAFELGEHEPLQPGSEEYLHSEKYEIRHWDLDRPDSLAPLIARVNAIRRAHPALQGNDGLAFQSIDDDLLLAYTKRRGEDRILAIASLDPDHIRTAEIRLDLPGLGLADGPLEVEDLLDGGAEIWDGGSHRIELDPSRRGAQILALRPLR